MKSLKSFFVVAVLVALVFQHVGQAAVVVSKDAKWTSEPIKARLSSIALDDDNQLIYAGGSDGRLYAFNVEDGTLFYSTPAPRFGGGQCAAPLIGPDGTLYLAFTDGTLVAVTNAAADNPGVMWRYRTRAAFVGSPAMDEDGMLYIGSKDNQLHAVPSDQGDNFRATNAWVFNAKGDVTSSPLVTLLGDVVFLSGGTVFTVTSDGAQAGVFHAGSSIHNVPVAADDGTIFFGANNGFVYKVEGGAGTGTNASTGTNGLIFRLQAGAKVQSSAAIGAAGRIYIGTDAGRVLCTDDKGVVWRFPDSGRTRGAVRSDMSIGADGTIFAGTEGHTLYAITALGQEKWHFDKFRGAMRSSPVIDRDGTVYFSAGRSIFAVADNVPVVSEAPWTQFRGNAQHSATSTHDEIFITQAPQTNLSRTLGASAAFSVVAHSSAPLFYQWSRDGIVLAGATNSTLVIANVQATNAGIYRVSISNAFQPVIVLAAQLTIESAPPVIVTDLTHHFISVGSNLRLEIAAAGTPPLSYQWRTNGVSVPDATNASLNFVSDVPTTAPIAFDVMVSNAIRSTNSSTSLVTVVALNLTRPAILIGAGNRFSSAIVSNQLFTWGSDASGQLGDGGFTNRLIPTRTSTNIDWLSVSAGGRGNSSAGVVAHALALQVDGSLYAWGANASGQLGIGTTNESRIPVRVGGDMNWIQAEAGASHSVALRTDGTLWTWGGNQNGELGLGHTNRVLIPTRVGADSAWVEVRAGGSFTLARRADGTLWGWGRNDSGQLGNSNEVHAPVQIGTNNSWINISAGVSHSLALRNNGTLWMWGRNFGLTNRNINLATNVFRSPFQVGTNADWKVIDAGYDHSLAINTAGKMFAFGANNLGQLGNGEAGASGGSQTNLANKQLPVPIGPSRDWQSIEAGVKHSVARATDGSIWAWGWNNSGQVGDGTTTNHNIPVLLTFTNFANINTNGTNIGPPVFIRQPDSKNVAPNSIVTFSVAVSGAPLTGMLWYFNTNSPIPIATNLSYTFFAQQGSAGTYQIVVTNSSGVATSAPAILTFTTNSGGGLVSVLQVTSMAPVSAIRPMLLPVLPGTNGIIVPVLNGSSSESFVLEFKNLLTDSNWTAIVTNQGPITNLVDPAVPGTSRYYRLRVQ